MTDLLNQAKKARSLAMTARRLADDLFDSAVQSRLREVALDLDGEAAEFEQAATRGSRD